MDDLIQKILAENSTELEGADSLLYNLAFQIDAHRGIRWTPAQIVEAITPYLNHAVPPVPPVERKPSNT